MIKASQARSSALEQATLAIEDPDAPGTPVDPDIRLRSYKLGKWKQEGNVDPYEESGSRFYAKTTLGAEWASNEFSGRMTHSQDYYMYDGAMGLQDPVTVGTNGRKRTYALDPYEPIDPQTYTFGGGQAIRAEQYPYGIFTGFKLNMSHMKAEKSGNITAQALKDNEPLPGTLTSLGYEPLISNKFYIKTASTLAGLAAAPKLREAFDSTFEYGGIFGVAFPMVDDNISWEFPVELFPSSLFTVNIMKRALGMGFLTQLHNATTCYFEIGCLGALIEGIIFRSFKLIVAGDFSKPFDSTTIEPGIEGVTWSFYPTPQDDMPNGSAFSIEVINNIP